MSPSETVFHHAFPFLLRSDVELRDMFWYFETDRLILMSELPTLRRIFVVTVCNSQHLLDALQLGMTGAALHGIVAIVMFHVLCSRTHPKMDSRLSCGWTSEHHKAVIKT
jgi:hypothetical protein